MSFLLTFFYLLLTVVWGADVLFIGYDLLFLFFFFFFFFFFFLIPFIFYSLPLFARREFFFPSRFPSTNSHIYITQEIGKYFQQHYPNYTSYIATLESDVGVGENGNLKVI